MYAALITLWTWTFCCRFRKVYVNAVSFVESFPNVLSWSLNVMNLHAQKTARNTKSQFLASF